MGNLVMGNFENKKFDSRFYYEHPAAEFMLEIHFFRRVLPSI